MAVIQHVDRAFILRMIDGALCLVPLHHGNGFRPQRAAQALQLRDKMWNIRRAIGENDRLERFRVGQCVLDAEPGAPGLTQQMNHTQPKRLTDNFHFFDVAL